MIAAADHLPKEWTIANYVSALSRRAGARVVFINSIQTAVISTAS